MAQRGRKPKIGSFEVSNFFTKLMEHGSFVDVDMLSKNLSFLAEPLSPATIRRLLKKWGMQVDSDKLTQFGGPTRNVIIHVSDWVQPSETRHPSRALVSGVIWILLNGKGMAFMLTADGRPETAWRVALVAVAKLKSRKRRVFTNHSELQSALKSQMNKWIIELL